jgi:hypothetical protein
MESKDTNISRVEQENASLKKLMSELLQLNSSIREGSIKIIGKKE